MLEPEQLLHFTVPEAREIKAYLVRTKEGKIIARTEDELKDIKSKKEKEKK